MKSGRRGEWEPGALEECKSANAILMGAFGLPNVMYSDGLPAGEEVGFGLRLGLSLRECPTSALVRRR